MAATKKVGELVKEARAKAKMTQEQLAQQVDGVSASDIGKCERGEKDLSQAALKQIAKATGVTQKSLLEAPKNIADAGKTSGAAKTSSSGKTSSGKTASSSAKTSSSGKTSSSSSGKAAASTGEKLTAAEKRVLELYRAAGAAAKKNAEAVLKGTVQVAETAADKRVLELYHAADSATKKNAEAVLKGTKQVAEENPLMDGLAGGVMELLSNLGKK